MLKRNKKTGKSWKGKEVVRDHDLSRAAVDFQWKDATNLIGADNSHQQIKYFRGKDATLAEIKYLHIRIPETVKYMHSESLF